MLFPGAIAFSAIQGMNGTIAFSINLAGDYANPGMSALFHLGGNDFEHKQWEHFLDRVREECK